MFQTKSSFRLLSTAALLVGLTSVTCFAQDIPARSDTSTAIASKPLPLSGSSAAAYQRYDAYREEAQQQIRQRVQFEIQQRVLREQWNQWIGYSPARPTVNASNLSNGFPHYYVPSRGQIVNSGMRRAWNW